jgi:hypothetical protein
MGTGKLARTTIVLAVTLMGVLLRAAAAPARGPAYLVKDINTRGESSSPSNLADVNGTLFFSADDGSGVGLWKSDGSETGTMKVRSFTCPLGDLIAAGDTLFFQAGSGSPDCPYVLWRSDGTPAGTTGLTSESALRRELASVHGTLFFIDYDSPGAGTLWKSNGTVAGTLRLTAAPMLPRDLTTVGGTLFFSDDYYGSLWKSDGTETGTVEVKFLDFVVLDLTDVSGTVYFTASRPRSGAARREVFFFAPCQRALEGAGMNRSAEALPDCVGQRLGRSWCVGGWPLLGEVEDLLGALVCPFGSRPLGQ